MPRRYHRQATFNEDEIQKIKKVQGTKTDGRFFREAVTYYVREAEREAVARGHEGNIPTSVPEVRGTEERTPPFLRVKSSQNGSGNSGLS
jgi:hypothetical protein